MGSGLCSAFTYAAAVSLQNIDDNLSICRIFLHHAVKVLWRTSCFLCEICVSIIGRLFYKCNVLGFMSIVIEWLQNILLLSIVYAVKFFSSKMCLFYCSVICLFYNILSYNLTVSVVSTLRPTQHGRYLGYEILKLFSWIQIVVFWLIFH